LTLRHEGTVVVTGANSGIGLALVRSLAKRKIPVCACDVRIDALSVLESDRFSVVAVDVRDSETLRKTIDGLSNPAGISGLVTCAAVFRRMPFLELTEQCWDETFAINLDGSLFACQAVLPLMVARGGGSIVMLSSSLARTGSPTGGHYAATKGGLLGLMRSLALEVADRNIRVNAVSPGLTDTPQPRAHAGGIESMMERARTIPLRRIGQPSDIVAAIEFLLGEESSFVTGQDIQVNGGSRIS
jgi:2-hydroxycyclohexanecarboxyl-CoA dehydrogenase